VLPRGGAAGLPFVVAVWHTRLSYIPAASNGDDEDGERGLSTITAGGRDDKRQAGPTGAKPDNRINLRK